MKSKSLGEVCFDAWYASRKCGSRAWSRAAKAVAKVHDIRKWRSVDNPPKQSKWVLITGTRDLTYTFWYKDKFPPDYTHWMPLPKGPKGRL